MKLWSKIYVMCSSRGLKIIYGQSRSIKHILELWNWALTWIIRISRMDSTVWFILYEPNMMEFQPSGIPMN